MRHSVLALGVLAAACGATEPPEASSSSWSIDTAEVVFTSRRADNVDLYVIALADGATRRLTIDPVPDNFGRPSPDGQWVAFQSRPAGGPSDILVMPIGGGEAANLTDDPDWDVLPAWSPDGRELAFMSTRGFPLGSAGPFPGHIYVMNADGSDLRQVTTALLSSSLGPQDWSPDGRFLLMGRDVDGQIDLFRLDVDAGEETPLATEPTSEYGASLSPDGQQAAFHDETDDASQIAVMNIDGSGRRALTSGPGRRYGPRWSPDGQWLVFTVEAEGGQYDIHALRVADGATRVVIATSDDEREPAWLPGAGAG